MLATYCQVLDVNTNGVLYTAQAAGRQMRRFKRGGSIILIASMSGSITNKVTFIARENSEEMPIELTGSRLGVVQQQQICGSANGAQHGM
jgi:NAD(P)-dependent dehydrogenase (short-subunit alcohol dehydrogenase family)